MQAFRAASGLTLFIAAALVLGAGAPVASDEAAPGPPVHPGPTAALGQGILLARVYASAVRDDEFVVVVNAGPAWVDVSGWTITDLEGSAAFPDGTVLAPGGRVVASRNSTSYLEDVLEAAEFTYDRGDAPRMEGGGPRLADAGDEVLLLDASGAVVDACIYGDSAYAGPGWTGPPARTPGRGEVLTRLEERGSYADVGTATDWDGLRDHRLGQSAFEPEPLETSGPARAFVSPQDGVAPLLAFLGSAGTSLELSGYTLTSETIASALAAAAARGVRVRVLLDGSPAGGLGDASWRLASALVGVGAEVRWLVGAEDVVKRYRYLHAKYVVVDARAVWITSENFGEAGFPTIGGSGSRGWSVAVEDETLAAQLREVFEQDFDPRRRDSIAAEALPGTELSPVPPAAAWSAGPRVPPRGARLVMGPDTSLRPDGVLGLIASARESVWVESLYLEEVWRDRPNPYLGALWEAAARGVRVKVLLDGSAWSAAPGEDDNDDVVARLNARSRREGVPLEARLVPPGGALERVHNKGLLVDGRVAFVSSLNWGHTSATENREVGFILEDPAVAGAFEAALRADWDGSYADEGFRIRDPAVLVSIYAIVAVASVASFRALRAAPKGLKTRARFKRRAPRGAHLRRRRGEVRLLPPELVAQPRDGARGRDEPRRRREAPRGGLRGPPGHRDS